MTLAGKVTVIVSDDERYEAGKTYDVILSTGATPDPSQLVTGSLDTPQADSEPASTTEA